MTPRLPDTMGYTANPRGFLRGFAYGRGSHPFAPAQLRLAGGGHFIEALARGGVRVVVEFFAFTRLGFSGDVAHHLDEAVEHFPALRFSRLDQHRARENEREIDGHRVEAVLDQRFGDNNTLTGRFNINDSLNIQPTAQPVVNNTVGNTFTNAMISDTHSFGPTTILDVRLGYHRNNLQITDNAPGGASATAAYISTYGFQGVPSVKGIPLFPQYSVGGNFSVSDVGRHPSSRIRVEPAFSAR